MCLVTWPLDESKAGVDLVLIQTSLLAYLNDADVMIISRNLHKKSKDVSIKARSTLASLSFKGQVSKPITVNFCRVSSVGSNSTFTVSQETIHRFQQISC